MRKQLTDRQAELVDWIDAFITQNGYPPSVRQMAAALQVSSLNGVNDLLKACERKGHLKHDANIQRSWRPV